MQTHIRVFCSGSQFGRRPAKVDPVVRNKIPVAFEDDALEFQVLRARLSEVIHMRANNSPRLGGRRPSNGSGFHQSLRGMEARVGIEPTHKGFADLSLTTWVPRLGKADRLGLV